jgi:hypothetical protein
MLTTPGPATPDNQAGQPHAPRMDPPADDAWNLPALPGKQAALEALCWNWGVAYDIGVDGGQWWYRRRDGLGGTETAITPDDLHIKIANDYTDLPVRRQPPPSDDTSQSHAKGKPTMPAQSDTTPSPQASHGNPADPEDLADLADLAALAEALNTHTRLAALLLTPPGKPPWVDVGLHGVLAPGEKVRAQAGMFFWRLAEPLGRSDQPAAAAALIARILHPTTTNGAAMTTYSGPDGEPTLADLEQEFPGWTCWENFGRCYATREPTTGSKELARGEDPLDLRTSILLLLQVEEYERETAQHTSPGRPS